jgi:HlyD family secretion protein
VREAKATLLAAQANLERTKVEAEGPDLPFLKAAMERARRLHHQGLIATSVMEDAEMNYELGRNKQVAAHSSVAVNRAEVARAQAALERAETDLRNSTIVSPMNGLVLSRDVEVGDAVSSILVLGSQATLIMTLGDVGSVYVLGKVDEADIGKVFLGQPARIVVESFKERKFEGKVTKISPLGQEKDNVTTFEVRVSIENPTGELKANMTANAEIILEEKKGVLLVPESAVIYDRDRKTFLEVPDPGASGGKRKMAARLGLSNGVKAEVVDGPKEGEQVVLQ